VARASRYQLKRNRMPAFDLARIQGAGGFPKFGDDITPDILPTLVRLKCIRHVLAKTFRFVRAPLPFPLLFPACTEEKRLRRH